MKESILIALLIVPIIVFGLFCGLFYAAAIYLRVIIGLFEMALGLDKPCDSSMTYQS